MTSREFAESINPLEQSTKHRPKKFAFGPYNKVMIIHENKNGMVAFIPNSFNEGKGDLFKVWHIPTTINKEPTYLGKVG